MADKYFKDPNACEKGPSGCLVVLLLVWLLLAASTLIVIFRGEGWGILALNLGLLAATTIGIKFIRR